MSVTINGEVADIFIGQSGVNSGNPFPFLLWKREKPIDRELVEEETANLSIQIEVNQDSDPITMDKAFFFPVLLKDHSFFTGDIFTQEEARENLYDVLGAGEGIFIQTSQGTYSALESDGFVITETQYEKYAIAQVRLSAENAVFLPAPNTNFTNSRWLKPDVDSYWSDINAILPLRYQFQRPTTPVSFWLTYFTIAGQVSTYFSDLADMQVANLVASLQVWKLNLLTMGEGETFIFAFARANTNDAYLELKYTAANGFEVRLTVEEDDTTLVSTSWYAAPVDLVDPDVQFNVTQATSAIAGDGEGKLFVDGVLKETLSNLQFYQIGGFTQFRYGAYSGLDAGTSGKLVIGEVLISNYIIWTHNFVTTSKWGSDDENQAYWR